MTPGARLSAAITLLDAILAGEPAERALSRWSRSNCYAGSKDRSAVRDVVFDGLRRRRSLGWLGGSDSGRAIVLAAQATDGVDVDGLFTGVGHGPAPISPEEHAALARDLRTGPEAVRLDCPDFLLEELRADLGSGFVPVLEAMRARAPVDLRVNSLKATRAEVAAALAAEGVATEPLALSASGLRVTQNARHVGQTAAYRDGLVELQDVSSQAVAETAGVLPGMTVLDYCAGGGGKTLALAAAMENRGRLLAWDANPGRMADLPERARRAGARVRLLAEADLRRLGAACDCVMVDAPCSGTGAWRRKPEGKWRLSIAGLDRFPPLQDAILNSAAHHVKAGGRLVYATCSLLSRENEARAAGFLARHPQWRAGASRRLSPIDGGDGFFVAVFEAPEPTPRA